MDRERAERRRIDETDIREVGGDRTGDTDAEKEQILEVLDSECFESMEELGVDLDYLSVFWQRYAKYVQEGHTSLEAYMKLRMLPQYQEDKTGFDYFAYLGLMIFTNQMVEGMKNADFKSE